MNDVQSPSPHLVVGIGASAGGLESIKRFLSGVGVPSEHAFVIIQHLSPNHRSMMPELLERSTDLKVVNVRDVAPLEPGSVYVVPSDLQPDVRDGFVYAVPQSMDSPRRSISDFFEGLASAIGERAVAIVLSGSGSDGAQGVREVFDSGGLVLTEGDSAAFDSMPRAASATKKTHLSLEPEEMYEAIELYAAAGSAQTVVERFGQESAEEANVLREVFGLLEQAHGIDFNDYKAKMVRRRVGRRIATFGSQIDYASYLEVLRKDPAELELLYESLLINVTSFFRDAEAWTALMDKVILPLCQRNTSNRELRVWVAGCSSGHEVYSLVQTFHEAFERLGYRVPLRVFATDVHDGALAFASAGIYASEDVAGLSSVRLNAMFEPAIDGKHRVRDALRQHVLFSHHDLLNDPPFGRVDVLTCRNLLIYLNRAAQARAVNAMQFALRMGGYLFLGPSESLNDISSEYEGLDRRWNIFEKIGDRRPTTLFPFKTQNLTGSVPSASSFNRTRVFNQTYQSLVSTLAGDAALIEPDGNVLHLFGDVARLLQPASGPMNTSLTSMCRGELRLAVGAAIKDANLTRALARSPGARFGGDLDVEVVPTLDSGGAVQHMLVRFVPPAGDPSARAPLVDASHDSAEVSQQVIELEQELLSSRLALQSAIEELELTNEELQSTNEELHANLEELQSTNEELHSVNEELYSVNSEYELKLDEIRKMQRDRENLIRAAEVGVVFLTASRTIRFFSPLAQRAFNLITNDIGRDLAHITPRFKSVDLIAHVGDALASGETSQHQLELDDGRFLLAHIKPYLTDTPEDHGVILTFSDVTEIERLRREALDAKQAADLILDHIPQGVWRAGRDGANTFANHYLSEFCNRSPAEFRARGWEGMVHPDDLARAGQEWLDALDGHGGAYVSRFRMWHSSNSYRWVESRGTPVFGDDGLLESWYGVVDDIHEEYTQKLELERFNQDLEELVAQRARELELSEERLKLAGEYGTDGFWDWNLLTNEEYLSPKFKALFGYEDHEMENSPDSWRRIIHPDDLPKATEAFERHIEHGEPYDLVVRYFHKDGSIVWVICRGVAQKDEQGRWARMVGTHTDITDLKKAEADLNAQRSLAQSRALVEQVAESAPIMLWLANQNGEREYFNSTWTQFTGRSRAHELGDGWLSGVDPGSRERVRVTIERAVLAQSPYSVEYELRMRNGVYAPISERAVPYFDDEGAFAGYIGTVLDLTEQRRMAEEHRIKLERASSNAHLESLGVLAGGIAHDFNNILTAIIGPASLAKEEVERDSETFVLLTEIERAAHRAADLCRMLLDASGGATMSTDVVELNGLVTDSVSLLPAARRKSARLEWSLVDGRAFVEADPTQLRRVVMNVVLNAFDALEGEPGEVAVSTRVVDAASHPPTHLAPGFSPVRAGRFVVLEVRDDGHGISREDMRRIFEPFFSTKSKGKGRGLGLSATRGAVLNAGGVLEVESVVGAGTSMRLWFPALDVAPELDVVSDVAEHRVDIGEATVLVVDDERSVADMVDRVLSRGGLDVHTAYSATDALAICDALEATPRLAFIDYTMPDMFGDALAAKLRERYPDIGIILLSGYSVEHTDAALDRGTFDAFIAKPFEPEHLAHVARAHLEE